MNYPNDTYGRVTPTGRPDAIMKLWKYYELGYYIATGTSANREPHLYAERRDALIEGRWDGEGEPPVFLKVYYDAGYTAGLEAIIYDYL